MTTIEEPTQLGCDTSDMLLVHRVFRRELRLLPLMIRAVADGDTNRSRLIGTHAEEMLESLHHHHTGEDALLWPKLHQRVQLKTELISRMQDQHDRVSALIEAAHEVLPSWTAQADARDASRLVALLDEISPLLNQHLDEEEADVLPLVATYLSTTEWAELRERGMAGMSKPRLLVFLGYMLEDASPGERARFIRHVPPPARLAFRLVGRRKYRRESSRLRAGL